MYLYSIVQQMHIHKQFVYNIFMYWFITRYKLSLNIMSYFLIYVSGDLIIYYTKKQSCCFDLFVFCNKSDFWSNTGNPSCVTSNPPFLSHKWPKDFFQSISNQSLTFITSTIVSSIIVCYTVCTYYFVNYSWYENRCDLDYFGSTTLIWCLPIRRTHTYT